MSNWTLFSNHGHVLVCLARDPESRLRDVAAEVGITERAVQKIVRDLQDGNMVSITKNGRRNRYQIHTRQSLRHDLEAHCTLGDLIDFVNESKPESVSIEAVDPVEPDPVIIEPDPVIVEPDPVIIKQTESPPAKPEPLKRPLTPLAEVEPGNMKTEPEKPEDENSVEKQQGSLF